MPGEWVVGLENTWWKVQNGWWGLENAWWCSRMGGGVQEWVWDLKRRVGFENAWWWFENG